MPKKHVDVRDLEDHSVETYTHYIETIKGLTETTLVRVEEQDTYVLPEEGIVLVECHSRGTIAVHRMPLQEHIACLEEHLEEYKNEVAAEMLGA